MKILGEMAVFNSLERMLKWIEPHNLLFSKEIDVVIDVFTPCLIHRESGEIYDTEYH